MFDISVFEFDNEIETIKNLNSKQKDQILKILSRVKEKLRGFKFDVKSVDLETNVNQLGRRKIDYLEYDPDDQHWVRK